MLVRISSGSDGESHFETVDPAFEPTGRFERTKLEAVDGVEFVRLQSGLFFDWHPAPRRQYVFTMVGAVELGIGDGTVMTFRPGDVLLAEDLSGRGHTTRVVGDGPAILAWVRL